MSYITYDYLCSNCDTYEERFVKRDAKDKQDCSQCGALMRRLPPGPITTFKFGDRAAIKSRKAVSLRDKRG